MGTSPDGRKVLLSLGDRVAIYDTTTRDVHTVFPFGCEYVEWSHNGQYIAGVSYYPSLQQSLALYVVAEDRWQFLPLPDSTDNIPPIVSWLPGDTSLAVGFLFPSDIRSHSYDLGIKPPHAFALSPEPHFNIFAGSTGIAVEGSNRNVRLRVGQIGNVDSMKTYSLSTGIIAATGFNRISSDGNWMLFRMDADIGGSRFGFAGKVTSLGIIDLRPGSSTQYQLYRVFPDYTNTYRNCSAAWFFSGGAWSGDGKYVYHEQVRIADSTTQIVRRDIRTGKVVAVSNFLTPP
jgi:hypothetical protein